MVSMGVGGRRYRRYASAIELCMVALPRSRQLVSMWLFATFSSSTEGSNVLQLSVDVDEHALEMQLTMVLTNMYTIGIDADMHPSLYAFRTQVIDRVLKEHLVPMALQAVREEMAKKAQEYVTDTACETVWIEATTPPLQLKAIDDEVRRLHHPS